MSVRPPFTDTHHQDCPLHPCLAPRPLGRPNPRWRVMFVRTRVPVGACVRVCMRTCSHTRVSVCAQLCVPHCFGRGGEGGWAWAAVRRDWSWAGAEGADRRNGRLSLPAGGLRAGARHCQVTSTCCNLVRFRRVASHGENRALAVSCVRVQANVAARASIVGFEAPDDRVDHGARAAARDVLAR